MDNKKNILFYFFGFVRIYKIKNTVILKTLYFMIAITLTLFNP